MIKFTRHFLKKLEDLLSDLGFLLRYEKGNFQSGYCLVENRNIVVVNKFLDTENRIQVLLDIIPKLEHANAQTLTPKSRNLWQQVLAGQWENAAVEEEANPPAP